MRNLCQLFWVVLQGRLALTIVSARVHGGHSLACQTFADILTIYHRISLRMRDCV